MTDQGSNSIQSNYHHGEILSPVILKIGGSVLRSIDGFSALLRIVQERSNRPTILVVSALSHTTRQLESAGYFCEDGLEEEGRRVVNGVIDFHTAINRDIITVPATREALEMLIVDSKKQLLDILRGVAITRQLSPRTLDRIRAFGELLSVQIILHFLQEHEPMIRWISSADLIVTDSTFGEAIPDLPMSRSRIEQTLLPELHERALVITQGFVARNSRGDTTTMGRESSSLTALLLAELTSAEDVILYTDVDGIQSADPRVVKSAVNRPVISSKLVRTLSYAGLKLIPPTILPYLFSQSRALSVASAFQAHGITTISNDPHVRDEFVIVNRSVWLHECDSQATQLYRYPKRFLSAMLAPHRDLIVTEEHDTSPEAIRIHKGVDEISVCGVTAHQSLLISASLATTILQPESIIQIYWNSLLGVLSIIVDQSLTQLLVSSIHTLLTSESSKSTHFDSSLPSQ